MDLKQLEDYLKKKTDSERWHLSNPETLSPFYMQVKKKNLNGQKMFYFNFDKNFQDSNVLIIKESRFTRLPLHFQRDMEMIYVYSGNDIYVVNGEKIHLRKGDLIILDSDVQYYTAKTKEKDDIVINFIIKKYYFDSLFLAKINHNSVFADFIVGAIERQRRHDHYIVFNTQNNERFHTLIQYSLSEYFSSNQKHSLNQDLFYSYINIIFQELVDSYYNNKVSHFNQSTSNSTIEILDYIDKNFLDSTLLSTASQFGYNPKYLSYMLKKTTGMSFKK